MAVLTHAAPTPALVGRTSTGSRLDLGDFPGTRPTFTDAPLVPGVHQMRAVHIRELRTRLNDMRVQHGLAAVPWTDPALGPSVFVRASHVTELRTALDALYAALGRTPPAYTDPVLSAGSTVIRAAHVNQLRAAVEALEE
jgi:hypothetical protein